MMFVFAFIYAFAGEECMLASVNGRVLGQLTGQLEQVQLEPHWHEPEVEQPQSPMMDYVLMFWYV